MKEYVLVGDSTEDLNVDVLKTLDVQLLTFSYSVNDEVIPYYMDERDGDIADFYDRLRKGAMPVTSQINPDSYKKFFEEIVKDGKDILYLCFTSGLSGSYQSAIIAADMVCDKYPDARIEVIDSLVASVGGGILLYQADKKKKEGLSLDELKSWIEENRLKTRHWFMVEDLFHLKRGGRVTTVEAMIGSALKIKPILSLDEEGKLIVKSKARGTGKALEYLVSRVEEEVSDFENMYFNIGNADAYEKAERLKEMLMEKGAKEEHIFISSIGPIIGTHVGPGMAAIAYVNI
ncbi:MAG: DegV family protein [Lachnospiraceae bacterium]|nr:DegV family protein [Lachnospiraceae bacterium]MBQ9233532.1 DegV family protein [Lachnospiraceae bacterium]